MIAAGIERVQLMLRRDGAAGGLLRIARRLASYVRLSEDHIWFVLDVSSTRPKPPLGPGLTLMRPGTADVALLAQLTSVVPREARARIEAGHDLWLVLAGERVLVNMWVFRNYTPAIAAPSRRIPLPLDTVCLEDVEVIRAARGAGIGPAAYAAIADTLSAEGKRWIVYKTTVENTPARRAVAKAGFEQAALMHFRRRGRKGHTSLKPFDGPAGSFFMEHIGPGIIYPA